MSTIQDFVSRPDQKFTCYAAGPESSERFTASIRHTFCGPASEEEIKLIADYGVPDVVMDFFRQHNGFTFYQDSLSDTAGVRLAPISEWPQLCMYCEDWWNDLDEDERDEYLPGWLDESVVIGEVPHSGNYFLLKLDGEDAGAIIYFCHDGFEFEKFASSFDTFLRKVTSNPPELLMSLGCYARYSDGKSQKQWIPKTYIYGA